MAFPAQLKLWRMARGFTQEGLAQKAGVPRPNLVEIEAGRRDCTLKTLGRLAYALDLRPGVLLEDLPPGLRKLDRHQIDAAARFLVKMKVSLDEDIIQIAEGIRPRVEPILRAAGLGSQASLRKKSKKSRVLLHPETIDLLIRRIHKLVASLS